MARIPMWNEKDPATPEDVREALGYVEAVFGPPLNTQREMTNHPRMVKSFSDPAAVPYRGASTITPVERELAYTTATVINDCHY